jgi:hypothetical protein
MTGSNLPMLSNFPIPLAQFTWQKISGEHSK